jgi:hypothetical protein
MMGANTFTYASRFFWKASLLGAEFVVVAHEGAHLHAVGVAAEQVRHADEAQQVILVFAPLPGVAPDQVLERPDRQRQPGPVEGVNDPPGGVGRETFVVEVGGDVVGAGAVAAEHAQVKPLRPNGYGFFDDLLQRQPGKAELMTQSDY